MTERRRWVEATCNMGPSDPAAPRTCFEPTAAIVGVACISDAHRIESGLCELHAADYVRRLRTKLITCRPCRLEQGRSRADSRVRLLEAIKVRASRPQTDPSATSEEAPCTTS